MKKIVSVLVVSSLLSGCATIFGSSSDIITISSKDPAATILVNGNEVGNGSATYTLKRGKQAVITASKKGCQDRTVITDQSVAGAAFFNLIFVIGWLVDAVSGALYKADPTQYTVTPACA